jgi:hypothetical protein
VDARQRAAVQVGIGMKIRRAVGAGGSSNGTVGSGHLFLPAGKQSNAHAETKCEETGLKTPSSGRNPAEFTAKLLAGSQQLGRLRVV